MKLYVRALAYDVRSKMPHIVGPAGSGKTSSVEHLAEVRGVNLHVVNVSRMSPLEVEGVQMPHGSNEEMALRMLPATYWTQLKEGDILLFDELLACVHPEIFIALLDIFTSRRVGSYRLPKVFMVATSNSVITSSEAMRDRLLHILVADPRRSKAEQERMATILVNALGLLPSMVKSPEMDDLLKQEVLPMYNLLDSFKDKSGKILVSKDSGGTSLRSLIGQAQLGHVTTKGLAELINVNNIDAMQQQKLAYVLLMDGTRAPKGYYESALKLKGHPKLSEVQALNLDMNLQLIELHKTMTEEEN